MGPNVPLTANNVPLRQKSYRVASNQRATKLLSLVDRYNRASQTTRARELPDTRMAIHRCHLFLKHLLYRTKPFFA